METPPIAPTRPTTRVVHGHEIQDPYTWLHERSEETLAYLQAENDYAKARMADVADLEQRLRTELRARIQETDRSAPIEDGGYFYFSRTQEGKSYPRYCRAPIGDEASEEVLLDLNALVGSGSFIELGSFETSPDHRLLAYSTNTNGDERFDLFVKDLSTGEHLAPPVPDTGPAVAWASDCRTLFYLELDEANRPCRVMRRIIDAPVDSAELVYEERDEAFHLDIDRTRSGAFVLIVAESETTTEVRCVDAAEPADKMRTLLPRRQGIEYTVDHQDDRFWVLTNDGARNFRLMEAPLQGDLAEHWQERIGEDPEVMLDSIDCFARHLVVSQRKAGLTSIRVIETEGFREHCIDFDEPLYVAELGGNPRYDVDRLRLRYSSLVTPLSDIDYELGTRARTLRKQQPVRGYDPGEYEMLRVEAPTPDGERVAISLAGRKGVLAQGPAPLYLVGYGAYGLSYDPEFDRDRLSLLERGVVFGIAHIRGGSEQGRRWYDEGKLLHKRNTFDDFVACVRHLVDRGITTPEQLVVEGGSAGGLLIGVVLNERPDLCKAAVADVPFVDVLNSMLDPTLPLTVIEYEEWGNPKDQEQFEYMAGYSPYDNIRPQAYPHLLVQAGLYDTRVSYREPAKYVARLRAERKGGGDLLLKTNLSVGHGGEADRYAALEETAFEYAFVLKHLGLADADLRHAVDDDATASR